MAVATIVASMATINMESITQARTNGRRVVRVRDTGAPKLEEALLFGSSFATVAHSAGKGQQPHHWQKGADLIDERDTRQISKLPQGSWRPSVIGGEVQGSCGVEPGE